VVNEPDFICEIEKSIRLEFIFLIIYLMENAIDLLALLAHCVLNLSAGYCSLGIAFCRFVVFGVGYLTQRKNLSKKVKRFFATRKLLNVGFWLAIAVCTYFHVSLKPAIVILIAMAVMMFSENCNCNGDVF
jgi:hypothetical protein